MATSKPKVTLKLLIDEKESKVLLAEASKDFVDFLFYIFSLPFGSIVKFLKNETMVGCFGDLYKSIETLSEPYILSNQKKNSVLNPNSPLLCPTEIPLLQSDDDDDNHVTEAKNFYTCSSNCYVTDAPSRNCPECGNRMIFEMPFVSPDMVEEISDVAPAVVAVADQRGFVKDGVNYMVMDNLEVKVMSTISCITLINKFHVNNLGSLEERVVDFGLDEGLKLLKASMECKNVLSSIFLGNMKVDLGTTPSKSESRTEPGIMDKILRL